MKTYLRKNDIFKDKNRNIFQQLFTKRLSKIAIVNNNETQCMPV
jgi:hypothetical protein